MSWAYLCEHSGPPFKLSSAKGFLDVPKPGRPSSGCFEQGL